MALRLVQLRDPEGVPMLAAKVGDGGARRVGKFGTAVALAQFAIDGGLSLAQAIEAELDGESVDLAAAEREARLLPAINDEDVARIRITGTGLTHLGSAESRDRMHRAAAWETPPCSGCARRLHFELESARSSSR